MDMRGSQYFVPLQSAKYSGGLRDGYVNGFIGSREAERRHVYGNVKSTKVETNLPLS